MFGILRKITVTIVLGAMVAYAASGWSAKPQNGMIVLCYHDVPETVRLDDYGVDQVSFVNTIEYFRTHGYHFIGLDDILLAHQNKKPLPEKPVLLTFDDGYRTFYDFVYPLLREYKIPSTLAVVSGWIDGPAPKYVKNELMTWEQIREVAASPYVEAISHSHDLHKGIFYNPQGNVAPAASNRTYDDQTFRYEDEKAYRERLKNDLEKSKAVLESRTGVKIRAIAWPFGQYNILTLSEAEEIGLEISFALNDKRAEVRNLKEIQRYLVFKNPELKNLLKDLKILPAVFEQKRIMQVDLDMLYDEDPSVCERNLSRLLDRVKEMAVSTVYLQAFSDPDGSGNVGAVYFPNRVLPMTADLFNRVAHQLRTRSLVEVYAWMPMLSIVLPDEEQHRRLRVREYKDGTIQLSSLWYERLTPFSDETWDILGTLYEDMAVHSFIDGVIFQDDGYLNDFEDFHPRALAHFRKQTGTDLAGPQQQTSSQAEIWTQMKTDQLNKLSRSLMAIVKKHRPEAKFARTFYAPVLLDPSNEEWFAQNYEDGLDIYDFVVVMAYPEMEEVKKPRPWLKKLVRKASAYPKGMEKTVFKIQSYDWKEDRWIDSSVLNRWLRVLVAEGARHIAYYPDDFLRDYPRAGVIRKMMSKEDFPFKRDWK